MTGTVLTQGNLFDCGSRLLAVANAIQHYRLSKSGLTPQQLSDLDDWEDMCRAKALHIARAVSDAILASLQDSIQVLRDSTGKVKKALENLAEVSQVIQGITEVIEIANSIIAIIS